MAAMRHIKASHSALYLGVTGMTNEHHITCIACIADHLKVDFGDQRTGRIEHGKTTTRGLSLDCAGDAMRAEDQRRPIRHLVQLFDKHRPERTQALNHLTVVHDFMTHINGLTKQL